jgi:uncharacterized membrane protein
LILAVAGGLAYPLVVYFGMAALSPPVLALLGLGLIGLRLLASRKLAGSHVWLAAFGLAGGALLALLLTNAELAAKAYPVAVSLAVAGVFGLSLVYPPTVVERIARLSEPDLPPQGVAYTRKVTLVWVVFLLANAAVSTATALWGSLAQWTLWNGLLSYLAMGTLFAGEFMTRRLVRQ